MERERFLDAVAHRLGRPRLTTAPPRPEVVPPWATIEESLVARFSMELERVGGTVSFADSALDLATQLKDATAGTSGAPTVAIARSEFESFGLSTHEPPLNGVFFWGDRACNTPARFRQIALRADLGITTASLAIAATGTLVLCATSKAPRSVSLLPRRHLALIHESQLVAHLGDALPGFGSLMPSALVCVTGPSRTSDIENDLSIGVHGPAEVHVIVCRGATS